MNVREGASASRLAQQGEAAIPKLKAAGFPDLMIQQAPQQKKFAQQNLLSD